MIVHIHTYTHTRTMHSQNIMYGLFREYVYKINKKTFINEIFHKMKKKL